VIPPKVRVKLGEGGLGWILGKMFWVVVSNIFYVHPDPRGNDPM